MKNSLLIVFAIFFVIACKKEKQSPEGPTDVRIRNLTTLDFKDIIVDIDTAVSYGAVDAKSTSSYVRFPKAYPKANITVKVNRDNSLVTYSSAKADYLYMQCMGRMKITYELFIPNMNNSLLEINVIAEEEIFLDQE